MKNKKLQTRLLKMGAVLLALIFWQIAAMVIHQHILLVSPLQVLVRLFTIWQVQGFWTSLWCTLYHILAGFFLGLFAGIALGVLSVRVPWVEYLLWPWMATIKSVPVASFVVICLIWLSPRNLSILISFLIVLPIIYHSVRTGLQSVDPAMLELAKVYDLNPWKRLRYITLPKLKEPLLSACTVSVGMAWKSGVAAEIIGIPNGSIGKMLHTAKTYLDTDDLLAWTVIIVILSVCTEKMLLWLLRMGIDGWTKQAKPTIRHQRDREL